MTFTHYANNTHALILDGRVIGYVDGTGDRWTAWLDLIAGRQVMAGGYGATFPDRETAGRALIPNTTTEPTP